MTESVPTAKKECVHRFISKDLTLRIAAVNGTEVVRHMQDLQRTFPLPTVAVGRSMIGALLLASQLKEGQQVGLLFRGNGALKSVYAEANFNGQVRGYTPNPAYQPENYDQGLSLSKAMGIGLLSVARHQPFQKQPFHGTVEMVSGEIGDDIAHYLHQSHQIRSLVSLGVYLDTYGKVRSAGGLIIEVMPGVDETVVEQIQKNAEGHKGSISELLLDGVKPVDLVRPFLAGIEFEQIEHDYPISYHCPCTKDRVVRALETLTEDDLNDMVSKNEGSQITCQVCGKSYSLSTSDLKEIRDKVHKASLH